MPGVLFSGYFGFGNCGDEAVLRASVRMLRERAPELRIAALSADPAATARAHGIAAYHRMRPRDLAAGLRGCDLLLSGGGSLLQDRTSVRSLLYYLAVIRLALALRRRVMVFAQGIGPLVRPRSRRMTGRTLRRVQAIAVRDRASAELLRELGVGEGPGPPVRVTADPVFALPPRETERVRALLDGAREEGAALLALNFRPWPGMEAAGEAVAAALADFERPPRCLVCPFQPSEDGPLCAALAERLGARARLVQEALDPEEWAALIAGTDAVLAARLHALIFAAAAARPALGIAYDPKVVALQERVGQPVLGAPGELAPEGIRGAVHAALADTAADAESRRARSAELRDEAARSAALALELLP